MTLEQLTATVRAAKVLHHVVRRGTGAYLVCPQGARVLGAWQSPNVENIFWTAPCCNSPQALRSAVEAGDWNLGGDRLWFSPELNLFVTSPQATGPEFVPASIDPGAYDFDVDGDLVTMRQTGSIMDGRAGLKIEFEACRTVRPVEPPVTDLAGLDYIGYELSSTLESQTAAKNASPMNLWQLAQVPPPGEVLIPTYTRARPYDFFSTGVEDWVRPNTTHVVFPVTGERRHKLGLESFDVCGRIGYLRKLSDSVWSLFVRSMLPVPGGIYPDFPIAAPDRRCFAIQCYNDGGQYGGFGEAEHHAPALTKGNTCRSADVSQLWAFAGPPEAIRRVAPALLGEAGRL